MTTKTKAKTEAIEAVAASEALTQAGTDTVVKTAEKTIDAAKQQAGKAGDLAAKSLDDVSTASRNAYETWLQSSDALAKGIEQVNKAVLGYAQSTLDANLNTTRQLMSCASVTEAVAIQTDHMKSSLDTLLAESNKVSEIATSTLNDAFAPLGAQFKNGIEKIWKPLAA
ncbi:MAG: phasin family protein [Alphaproteobacteria bacterium]